ncbi:mannose-1-phosphate guanylyltransferase/mannose-6-phosphate isomerase [Halomonas sp. ML-15]|uniref:mannose-1-phosphate guanylyltransferase/mannose-6-phosphate isomerase n=1 Tax=Halomonas sp. ML-15 TaxID=2773305 RepID=UPI001746AEAF|nr:mannose-1-phosphate guanylyltransferase/mannose-6-phosphate isomerase [Halomonas sp. ML-15]MBD3898280.1 mannose-1-phosphate guanylyltransferase/mannose-6-phosphate isomerase [Halomonas sp. ML-15]
MNETLTPVVLAGGSGSRLWPLSRQHYPKQFLALGGQGDDAVPASLLQQTLRRLHGLPLAPPVVVGSESHRFLLAEQLREAGVGDATLLLEPEGRNTAPAIACAALHARLGGGDPLLLVLPADHLIENVSSFQDSVAAATTLAAAGELVTFGVVPEYAETGYGYVQRGEALGAAGYRLMRFVEKPDRATAEGYLASGDYLWNSGMFMFRASRYLDELAARHPAMLAACRVAVEGAREDLDFLRLDAEAFRQSPADSIDYAVMEHASRAAVVPLDAGWSDIGGFQALWEASPKDACGNAVRGDVQLHDCSGLLVHAEERLVSALGVEDLVIIETQDTVLVVDRRRSQEVKTLVEGLLAAGREEPVHHPRVHRPWGSYQAIERGQRYQVKHITVAPGGRLSRQLHHHRAEHWVVVSGTARVSLGERVFMLSENESTYIPIGEPHRLENPGKIPLELIEVQSGSYLGEDDIVRFEDSYGRDGSNS